MPPVNANANANMNAPAVRTEHATPSAYGWLAVRVALSGIFLWAFIDKMFGLGYSTKSANAWINGGSPTNGFLSHAGGYFANFYHSIAGNAITDTLFMAALLGIGLALLLGVGLRIAAVSGTALLLMMWSVATLGISGTTNPVLDDHIVYACVLIALALSSAGGVLGLGRLQFVKDHPIIR